MSLKSAPPGAVLTNLAGTASLKAVQACQDSVPLAFGTLMSVVHRSPLDGPGRTPPAGWTRILKDPACRFMVDQYRGDRYLIGHFRCPPGAQAWKQDNVIGEWDLAVVPRTAVEIEQCGRKTVIGTANRAVFYNAHQVYRRRLLDPRGDDCVFFALPRPAIHEILAAEAIEGDQDEQPFGFSDAPIPSRSYLRFQRLLHGLRRFSPFDDLQIHEEVIQLVRELARSAATTALGRRRKITTDRRHRDLAAGVQRLLGCRFAEALTLEDIASEIGASPYHTARVFRDHTGQSIHEYRTRLRLHLGLLRLVDPAVRLLDLALELGFSSHGHFTHQFQRAFGHAPSALRGNGARLRALSRLSSSPGSDPALMARP